MCSKRLFVGLTANQPIVSVRLLGNCARTLFLGSLVLTLTVAGMAQRGNVLTLGAGNNILEGDLKVDETQAGTHKPLSYTIVLSMTSGTVIGRTTVANGGRYRFNDLADGDYDVAVEVEGSEISRSRVRLFAPPNMGKTDTRRDIELEWRANAIGGKGNIPGTVSAADLYKRSEANEKLFGKARKATDDKHYDQAVTWLRQLLENDPRDFQAWTELGTVYLLQEAYDDAEKAYLSAIEARPSFFLALLDLGRLYLAQKKFDKAIDILGQALQAKPESAEVNNFLGEAYLQVKKGSVAVKYLNEALRLDPKGMAEVHLRLAALYNGAGMKDKAATEYEEFLKQRPDYADKKKLEKYISENKKP